MYNKAHVNNNELTDFTAVKVLLIQYFDFVVCEEFIPNSIIAVPIIPNQRQQITLLLQIMILAVKHHCRQCVK